MFGISESTISLIAFVSVMYAISRLFFLWCENLEDSGKSRGAYFKIVIAIAFLFALLSAPAYLVLYPLENARISRIYKKHDKDLYNLWFKLSRRCQKCQDENHCYLDVLDPDNFWCDDFHHFMNLMDQDR